MGLILLQSKILQKYTRMLYVKGMWQYNAKFRNVTKDRTIKNAIEFQFLVTFLYLALIYCHIPINECPKALEEVVIPRSRPSL